VSLEAQMNNSCTKHVCSFKSDIKLKGVIFDGIAEKGDTDQVAKLQKENGQLTEKVERLEDADSTIRGEYKKARKALEFVMELVEAL